MKKQPFYQESWSETDEADRLKVKRIFGEKLQVFVKELFVELDSLRIADTEKTALMIEGLNILTTMIEEFSDNHPTLKKTLEHRKKNGDNLHV